MLLNVKWVIQKVKKETLKILELNENESTIYIKIPLLQKARLIQEMYSFKCVQTNNKNYKITNK